MADYYPLIAKAVAGLEKNTGEARRALYERARTALVTQLRGVSPALSESDITRERLALEESIRKIEAESARRARVEPTPRADKPASPPKAEPAAPAAPAPEPPAAPAPEPPAAPKAEAKPPESPKPGPTESAQRPLASRRGLSDRPSLSDQGLKGFRDVVAEAETLGEATAQASKSAREAFASVPAPGEGQRIEPHIEPEGLRPPRRPSSLKPPGPQAPPREAAREPARGPVSREALSEPVRATAFDLDSLSRTEARGPRDNRGEEWEDQAAGQERPFPLSRGERREQLQEDEEPAPPPRLRSYRRLVTIAALLLLVAGLGGVTYWQWPRLTALVESGMSLVSTPSAPPSREATPSSRPKISDRIGAPRDTRRSEEAAVAQRVVLYEEDPADPAGKRYVGSAVWRTDTIAAGPGQAPDVAVRADIEIPERKLTMKLSLRRNTDKALPASHTIEIMFVLPPDFPHGGISNIPGILMKQAEQTRGIPLAGLAVKVTTGFFLIGLSAVEADMQRNIQLLKERSWFDVPVVYNNGRRAIMAVEKGTPGDRAFADAFAAWGQ